jgi:phosphatidylinositol alpha 1,6-mannosyltransferase
MMRLALFSGNYNYLREGANQALNKLVAYLASDGRYDVRVYSPTSARPAFEPAGTLVSVPSIPLPVRSEFRLALGLPRKIRDDLRSFAPDIVHLSTPDILGLRAQTFAKRHGIPVVASLHTLFETYLEYYGLARARPLVEAHLRRFYRRCDHVLAPSPALVEKLKSERNDDHVSLWSRGVDRTLFNPARRDDDWRVSNGWSPDEAVVLFFGRLVAEKGVDHYVSTVHRLQRSHAKVRPLIVGAGPAAKALEALPQATMTGHLEGIALARAIASADLMLHPSKTETFGNVVLEAMACGVPVVCAATESAESLVEHGRTGMVCAADDEDCFYRAVSALVTDRGRRRQFGLAARERSAAFSWAHASQSVLEAYEKLLSRGFKRAP